MDKGFSILLPGKENNPDTFMVMVGAGYFGWHVPCFQMSHNREKIINRLYGGSKWQ